MWIKGEHMKILAFAIVACLSLSGFGASIQWNDFTVSLGGNGWWDVHRNILPMRLNADVCLSVVQGANDFSVEAVAYDLMFCGNWARMNAGDVVSQSTIRNKDSYFLHTPDMDEPAGGSGQGYSKYSISVSPNESFYLAFVAAEDGGENPNLTTVYGWVEIEIDDIGNLSLVGSAFDLDGGPMIVGGGSYSETVPEPSGGVLFLLGVAALGLRRRRLQRGGGAEAPC